MLGTKQYLQLLQDHWQLSWVSFHPLGMKEHQLGHPVASTLSGDRSFQLHPQILLKFQSLDEFLIY